MNIKRKACAFLSVALFCLESECMQETPINDAYTPYSKFLLNVVFDSMKPLTATVSSLDNLVKSSKYNEDWTDKVPKPTHNYIDPLVMVTSIKNYYESGSNAVRSTANEICGSIWDNRAENLYTQIAVTAVANATGTCSRNWGMKLIFLVKAADDFGKNMLPVSCTIAASFRNASADFRAAHALVENGHRELPPGMPVFPILESYVPDTSWQELRSSLGGFVRSLTTPYAWFSAHSDDPDAYVLSHMFLPLVGLSGAAFMTAFGAPFSLAWHVGAGICTTLAPTMFSPTSTSELINFFGYWLGGLSVKDAYANALTDGALLKAKRIKLGENVKKQRKD
ncbi:hypothetical protein FACS189472_01110 [Alphaproteobacteria bacterium]|nr:hypothetical protein FACS189472_01110 [Alphaproteobacteria bacterium]